MRKGVKRHNFEIINVVDYSNHSTLYHCKKNQISLTNCTNMQIKDYTDDFFTSLNYYTTFIDSCNTVIDKASKDVYIFGASYNTQYLLALGLSSGRIKGILDNSKEKQGNYLYGHELQIFDPYIISNCDCIVVLKNGCYVDEITMQLKQINDSVTILT